MDLPNLLTLKTLLQFVLVGAVVGVFCMTVFEDSIKLKYRASIKFGPFMGAAFGLLLHALAIGYVLRTKINEEELLRFFVASWKHSQQLKDEFAGSLWPTGTEFHLQYAIVGAVVVVGALLFLYLSIRGAIVSGRKADIRRAHAWGLYFRTNADREEWAGRVRLVFFVFIFMTLIPLGAAGYVQYLVLYPDPNYSEYFNPTRGELFLAAIPVAILVCWLLDLVFDRFAGPADA